MASGFKAIYENAKYEIILFLENDFILKASHEDIIYYFENAIKFIKCGNVDFVRGRSITHAGIPNFGYEWYKHSLPEDVAGSTHLSEFIYCTNFRMDLLFPSKIKLLSLETDSRCFYITSSRYCNYTNNPYMCSKEFFRQNILPHAYDGSSIEDILDVRSNWADKDFKCGFGFGIFTHDRAFDGH